MHPQSASQCTVDKGSCPMLCVSGRRKASQILLTILGGSLPTKKCPSHPHQKAEWGKSSPHGVKPQEHITHWHGQRDTMGMTQATSTGKPPWFISQTLARNTINGDGTAECRRHVSHRNMWFYCDLASNRQCLNPEAPVSGTG